MRNDAAAGVDGVTKEQYRLDLETNLRDLHARLKAKRYRHQPIRRVHIPKEGGKTRPIGVSAFEDKLVQDALRELLEAIYEQDFLDCSYGFRPGRSAHDAVRTLDRIVHRGQVNWILEADIVSFFDSLDRDPLKKMLEVRVADGSLLRLIGKCLHVGVLDGVELSTPEPGTAQGSVLSPLLGNVYLHYVLDQWFERRVKPRLRGKATLVRYADDFVIGFEYKDDAQRVMDALDDRLGHFGLTLHPDKTRLLPFRRPPKRQEDGKGRATFDFLGFTFYWARTHKGRWAMFCKTRSASLRRIIGSVYDCVVAIDTCRWGFSTRRSRGGSRDTSTTSASAATSVVCCWCSSRRGDPGTSGSAVGANASVSRGSGSRIYFATSRFRSPGSRFGSGARDTSRISGGAGWWKSPCPDLERARGG